MGYTLLKATFKNAGDFLIFERARDLLQVFAGLTDDRIELLSMRPIPEARLPEVNASRRVIICGGPGFHSSFYPAVYPLCDPPTRIRPPIVPFGLGWSGGPSSDPSLFAFTPQSQALLRTIHDRIPYSSCRDVLTHDILLRAGFDNALMTGCPVWYDLPSLGQPFNLPSEVRRLVVSTPQHPALHPQCRALLNALGRRFPDAQRYCVFHRGILPDQRTSWRDSTVLVRTAATALRNGYRVIDAAYGNEKIQFYRDCDLHVGYRVHAHLFFISVRKPSLLFHEDGRGLGQTRTLGTPGVTAWHPDALHTMLGMIDSGLPALRPRFEQAVETIESTLPTMRRMLESIAA